MGIPWSEVLIPGLLVIIGILGIVVPVIPGLLVAVAGVLLWAAERGGADSWTVFGIVAVIYLAGLALQFLVPGRRLKAQGVGTGTLLLALVIGIVGFFVVPVVGGPLGFVLGIFLVERVRSRDNTQAWVRTKHALHAVLTSLGIELAAGLLIAITWVVGVFVTR